MPDGCPVVLPDLPPTDQAVAGRPPRSALLHDEPVSGRRVLALSRAQAEHSRARLSSGCTALTVSSDPACVARPGRCRTSRQRPPFASAAGHAADRGERTAQLAWANGTAPSRTARAGMDIRRIPHASDITGHKPIPCTDGRSHRRSQCPCPFGLCRKMTGMTPPRWHRTPSLRLPSHERPFLGGPLDERFCVRSPRASCLTPVCGERPRRVRAIP
jgi:hypothetical protein